MELNIADKKEQKLLSRLEVKGKITFSGGATPSSDQVKEAIAKNLGKDAKLIVVKNIYTDYGSASADIMVYVYDDEKKMKELEETNKKSKDKKEGEDEEAPKEKDKTSEEKPVEKGKLKKEMSKTQSVSDHARKSKISDKPAENKE